MSQTLRPIPLLLVLAACGGSSAPPPPVAAGTPAGQGSSDLQPLSSRDTSRPGAPAGTGAAGPISPNAPLPPGHPTVGQPDPHGNLAAPGGAAMSAGSVTGTIALAPTLTVGPNDVLYLIAKKGKGTLAVRRVDKPSFPFAFEISGADVMTAGTSFEGPLDLVVRVSRTGDAIPAKGDIEGAAKGVKVPATGVRLTIDSVRQ